MCEKKMIPVYGRGGDKMVIPDFREIKAICNDENELFHYGVKGMKWGVRRRQRRIDRVRKKEGRILKTYDKYDKEIGKRQAAANKQYQLAVRKSNSRFSSKESAEKTFRKASEAQERVNRLQYKGSQQYKRYEKKIKKLNIEINEELKKRGTKYLDDVVLNSKSAYQLALSRKI